MTENVYYPNYFIIMTRGAYQMLELAGWIGQFANGMFQFCHLRVVSGLSDPALQGITVWSRAVLSVKIGLTRYICRQANPTSGCLGLAGQGLA